MRLLAEIKTPGVLLESISELGESYWRRKGAPEGEEQPEEYEVVYFSSNRLIHFEGALSPEQLKRVQAQATQVQQILINTELGELRIVE